jgi:hypothetical protein
MSKTAIAGLAMLISVVTGSGVAHADTGDVMYRVGSDIQPGTYRYTVTDNDMGAWSLCSDANCEVGAGLIDMDTIDGQGHTGYMTVPASAKYVKLYYLTLTPSN